MVAALIAIVVVAGAVGGVLGFRLLGGSADSLSTMAPSNTIVYVNAHLDPSAGQQLALNGLLNKFPSLGGSSRDATINSWIDSLLQPTGLTHSDVRPWLGSDISLVIPSSALSALSGSSTATGPDVVLIVSSTNDSLAQQAITTLRQKSRTEQWVTSTYSGVTLQIATGDEFSGAFAVTDHAFLFGGTQNALHEVIDTAQGKHAALSSNAAYTTAAAQVPSDRIGFAFVDAGAILQQLPKDATALLPAPSLDSLQGFRGVAGALVAQSNGVSIKGVVDFDPSKLTAQQRTLIAQPGEVNGSLAFMPRSTYAALALTGLKQTLQGMVSSLGSQFGFDISSVLDQLGITGPNGIVGHLSGDGGVDLTPEASNEPGGTVIIGTDSNAAAQTFVDGAVQAICGGDCGTAVTTQQDGDATISSLPPAPDLGATVQPSWTVYHGWVIIGSSVDQVKAALAADRSGNTLATNPNYTAVMNEVGGSNNGSIFIDVQPLVSAIRATLSTADQQRFDTDVAPNLNPIKAVGFASHSASDHVSIDMFTLIK